MEEKKTVYASDLANEIEGISCTLALMLMSIKENSSAPGSYFAERVTKSLYEIKEHLNRITDDLRTSGIESDI